MKTDRIIRQSVILFICTLAVFVTLPALAWDQQTIDSADKFYRQGLTAYNMKHWSEAASNFKQSFQVIPHSMTAYMLSATYLNLESPTEALRWAETATRIKPELQEPYITAVSKIIHWANTSKNDPYYTLTGKADEMNRPSNPHVKPPRPVLPQNSKLGIAPSTETMAPPAPGNTMQPLIPAQPITPLTLTGKWRCNDGGTYFIRQSGSSLWWYGRSQDGGRTWANVFHGRIQGNRIKGQWADIPQGRTLNSGDMILQIIGTNKLRATRKSGGFGGSQWSR
ncbi:MAG TPA: hypothetical protein ENK96_11315 [Desulfobulbaceae bacterium]|nr:hypothetical protein [Desulfobulbaceae bacterium]